MANTISNYDDIIDSRDVIARIEELEGEREALDYAFTTAYEDWQAIPRGDDGDAEAHAAQIRAERDLKNWEDDYGAELAALQALADEASGYAADWKYGETLIRDSYFRDYAMELADDIGAVPDNAQWPTTCIDWDQAARELQMDYTAVDFDGVTYWVR